MTKRWVQKREDKRPDPDFDGASADFEPYDVTCARCGKVLSCLDAFIEESDEWGVPAVLGTLRGSGTIGPSNGR